MSGPALAQTAPVPGGSGAGAPSGLPHDIRELLPYQTPWTVYALWAGVAVLALVALLLLYRKYRKKPAGAPTAPVEEPWDALLRRVRALRLATDCDRRDLEEQFFELSMLLREAIELRTRIRATDLTFQELRVPVRDKLPLGPQDVEAVLAFCERADLVKFAGSPSNHAEADRSRLVVETWIRQLRPPAASLALPASALAGAVAHGGGGA